MIQQLFKNNFSFITRRMLVAVINYSFLRISIFKSAHLYIKLKLRFYDVKKYSIHSTNYQWLIILDAIINSLDKSLKSNTVSVHTATKVADLWIRVLSGRSSNHEAYVKFKETHSYSPPAFLVISPGKSCNLNCNGCYANSGQKDVKLDWSMVNEIIEQAKELWGIKLITFSGGEPLQYKSNGKGIMDIVQAHPDLLFLMFTNGTLLNRDVTQRLSDLGNLTPAISVEGLEETTDLYRGKGVFRRILNSMEYMRDAGVPFGISVTVNHRNAEEVLSSEFLEFFFLNQKAFYAFYFQYLPIGRAVNLEYMPTPEQRVNFYNNLQKIIRNKRYFIIDFWNHGNLVNGCIAAGREDGYLYIDWDGKVMPCVFMPYSAGNVIDVFRNGGSLNDIWNNDFFQAIRTWQREYRETKNDEISNTLKWLMPCPFRDHHDQFCEIIEKFQPEPEDKEADGVIKSAGYKKFMFDYGSKLADMIKIISDKS